MKSEINIGTTSINVEGPPPEIAQFVQELSDKRRSQLDAHALVHALPNLSDEDLVFILKFMYPIFHNLVTAVTERTGKSISYVQRVLGLERRSAQIDGAYAEEFRSRLKKSGVFS